MLPSAEDGGDLVFDPQLVISPVALLRRLRAGEPFLLFDLQPPPAGPRLRDARPWPGPSWSPPAGVDVVLFDDDATRALPLARRLQAAGHARVRALYGGLRLYEFALDPRVVGERFLVLGEETTKNGQLSG